MLNSFREEFNPIRKIRSVINRLIVTPILNLGSSTRHVLWLFFDASVYRLHQTYRQASAAVNARMPSWIRNQAKKVSSHRRGTVEMILLLSFLFWMDYSTGPIGFQDHLATATLWFKITGGILIACFFAEAFLWKIQPIKDFSANIFALAWFIFAAAATSFSMCVTGYIFTSMVLITPIALYVPILIWTYISQYEVKITFVRKPSPYFPLN